MQEEIITETKKYIKQRLEKDSSGHDWEHIYRVHKLGRKIAIAEKANEYTVELSCLLHDIADFKLYEGDEEIGPRLAGKWLEQLHVNQKIISQVKKIISTTSFKGANAKNKINSLEGQCVQDADRLDAIGAIGIARCFAFGGFKGNQMYNPLILPNVNITEGEYKKANSTQINHFYEKLLLLKDRMNTQTAKEMAEQRHQFMEQFLKQFFIELDEG